MLAYYLDTFSPYIFRFGENFGVRWYGFAYVMAFVCGYWLYTRLANRGYSEMRPEQVGDFITWGALFGVMLGGRLGYVLLNKFSEYAAQPLDIFKLWDCGMSSHGGMIGLILFTLYYARRHKLSWPGIGDNLCVVAPMGLFFGRIANFINGELFGRVTNVPWACQFPKELIDDGRLQMTASERLGNMPVETILARARVDPQVRQVLHDTLTPRHPSQLYEALLEGVVLFCALWFLRTKMRSPRGVVTGAFFIIYALVRIIVENFREPDLGLTGPRMIGPLTRGQFLSLFLVLIGIAFVVYGRITKHFERADLAKMEAARNDAPGR